MKLALATLLCEGIIFWAAVIVGVIDDPSEKPDLGKPARVVIGSMFLASVPTCCWLAVAWVYS